MSHVNLLANALEYIENHLDQNIHTEDVAAACYCSKSTIEKLFNHVNSITIHDYITKRRMTKAAITLMSDKDINILDVAVKYGYGSNEAFTRAFKSVWNCKPSEFRSNRRFSKLFPRLNTPLEEGEEYMRKRRNFDISELYDLFTNRKNCYFVCADIKEMDKINDISRKAGDFAILEAINRLYDVAGTDDVVFRIGGDEFVILTSSEDEIYANDIIKRLKSQNGIPVIWNDNELILTFHLGTMKIGDSVIRYNELFTKMHTTILESKSRIL